VGKTKEMKQLESLINKMISKYKAEGIIDNSRSGLEDSPEKKQMEELIKKEFGFRSVEINIIPFMIPGASTIPQSILLRHACDDMPTSLTAHGEKWYDRDHNYAFYLTLNSEMFNARFTGGEVTAFILHEVGHNFDVSTMSYVGDFIYWATCFADGAILSPFIGHTIAKYISKFVSLIANLTPVALLNGIGISLLKILTQIAGPFGSLSYIGMMLADKAPTPREVIRIFTGFSGERFADSFVTAYGYGPELISAVDKCNTTLQTRNKGFLIDTWTWSGTIAPTILNMLIDPMPEAQTRARLVLDDMKKLSENPDLPPKIKTAVKSEYARCKKGYDLFLQVEADQRDSIAQRFSRQVKEAVLAGKCDLRTYLFNVSAVQAGVSVVNHSKKK
jgi:hypothetical protein